VGANGQPLPAGQTVSAQRDPPRLLADDGVDNGDGSYTVLVGSDRCGTGRTIALEVDGVPLSTTVRADFTCAPVAAAKSLVTTVPPDGRAWADGTIAFLGTVRDGCELPAFNRPATLAVGPEKRSTVVGAPAATDDNGQFAATLKPLRAGVDSAALAADGVSVGAAPIEWLLPSDSVTLAINAPADATAGKDVALSLTVTSRLPIPIESAALGLSFEGVALVDGSLLRNGQAATLRPDGLPELGTIGPASDPPVTVTLSALVDREIIAATFGAQALVAKGGRALSDPQSATLKVNAPQLVLRGGGCSCGSEGSASALLALLLGIPLLRVQRRALFRQR
jgi:hypothetical protein